MGYQSNCSRKCSLARIPTARHTTHLSSPYKTATDSNVDDAFLLLLYEQSLLNPAGQMLCKLPGSLRCQCSTMEPEYTVQE